jgi:hypothetical protein
MDLNTATDEMMGDIAKFGFSACAILTAKIFGEFGSTYHLWIA